MNCHHGDDENDSSNAKKVSEHPFHRALSLNDESIYRNYIEFSGKHQIRKKTGDWHGMLKLVETIKTEGFDVEKDPLTFYRKERHSGQEIHCTHGRHRLCILQFLYPQAQLDLTAVKGHHRHGRELLQLVSVKYGE
ncbi:MAG: hypothetical protein ACYCOU_03865 [Sulfobacillus sp.]